MMRMQYQGLQQFLFLHYCYMEAEEPPPENHKVRMKPQIRTRKLSGLPAQFMKQPLQQKYMLSILAKLDANASYMMARAK